MFFNLNIPSLPFEIDAEGRFGPDQVHVQFDKRERPTNDTLDALITAEWDKQIALAREHDRLLFNGTLLRYVDHTVDTDPSGQPRFTLTVGPTCYRDFVGTNLFNHHRLAEFGWDHFSNPVGTTATLITADHQICYGRRSAKVSYHANHVHTFGGAFEEADRLPDGTIDPFASVSREIEEELAIGRDELIDLTCVGLLRDKEIHQPEMLFEARLDLDSDEVEARWQKAEGRDEHAGLEFFANEPNAVPQYIQACGLIAPVASGALFLHGLHEWGIEWYQRAASDLAAHW